MARSQEHDLIWLRPEPNDRRPRFSRERITVAVIKIADTEGFEAVTMKRIAEELDCGTMTLYYYVRTKDDLVALMHDAILSEMVVPQLPADWRGAVCAIARQTRDVLLAHPWSVTSLNSAHFGPNAMRHVEQSLAALDGLNLRPADKLAFWGIVDDYVFGSALRRVAALSRMAASASNPKLLSDAKKFNRRHLASGQFPRLASFERKWPLPDQFARGKSAAVRRIAESEIQFERGLKAILDGLARSMNVG